MEKKKGLVYDSQNCFARFLKYEFKEYFSFDVYKNFKNFNDTLDEYAFMVFVVYSDQELIDLLRIYKRGVPLIVSTLNKEIKLKLEKIEDILLFDQSKIKSEMRTELKFYLNIVS
jgi:hypothetical protein